MIQHIGVVIDWGPFLRGEPERLNHLVAALTDLPLAVKFAEEQTPDTRERFVFKVMDGDAVLAYQRLGESPVIVAGPEERLPEGWRA